METINNNFFDDTFLARWMANSLSPEELVKFKNHPEYTKYVKIKQASENISFQKYDVNSAFEQLKTKKQAQKNTRVLPLYKYIGAIAAIGVLLLGLLVFNNFNSSNYKTAVANSKKIALPDGSIMQLNANSSAKIAENWKKNRSLNLKGEAFFKVKKGEKFSVNTALGKVQVLGTQFSINSFNKKLFTVKCFEGKVRVNTPENTLILTAGEAYQWTQKGIEKWKFSHHSPSWITNGAISFNKVPLPIVIKSLENHYKITLINPKEIPAEILFTGNYSKTDLNSALYTIFSTIELKYELINSDKLKILH